MTSYRVIHEGYIYLVRSQETIGRRHFFVDAIEKKLTIAKTIYICAIYGHAKRIKRATKPNTKKIITLRENSTRLEALPYIGLREV